MAAPRFSGVDGTVDEQWLPFLLGAAERFPHSLDLSATLDSTVRMPVPEWSDWAAVHLTKKGDPGRVATHATNPDSALLLEQCLANAAFLMHTARVAKRDEAALFVADSEDESVSKSHVLTLPLSLERDMFGTLTLGLRPERAPFERSELKRFAAYAHFSALAIHNAHQFQLARDRSSASQDYLDRVAHDLRTPLTAIHLMVHVLLRSAESLGPDELRARHEKLLQHVDHMSAEITRLLDVQHTPAQS